MILQYVFNTGIQYFVWVLQHTLPPTPWVDKPHPLLVFVVVEWPLSKTSILASTFYLVCQCNISFSEKPWDNYEILVFWVHIFQSRRGYSFSTFFALIIQVPIALSTVPYESQICLCIYVTQRVAWRFRPGLKLLCTLAAEMFGVGDFWLETRIIIKISTHPW